MAPSAPPIENTALVARRNFALIWTITIILSIAVWTGILVYLDFEKDDTLASSAKQVETHAKLLEEHTTRTVRVLDQTTVFIKAEIERNPSGFDLSRYSRDGVFLDSFFNLIATADENGQTQQIIPPRPASNIKDREHFTVHTDRDSENLFIS